MNRLRDLRENKDLTQKQLAHILSCSQATYSRYENEELNIPVDILKKLANFYKVSIDYIVGYKKNKN